VLLLFDDDFAPHGPVTKSAKYRALEFVGTGLFGDKLNGAVRAFDDFPGIVLALETKARSAALLGAFGNGVELSAVFFVHGVVLSLDLGSLLHMNLSGGERVFVPGHLKDLHRRSKSLLMLWRGQYASDSKECHTAE
jgi:hypothetical protein